MSESSSLPRNATEYRQWFREQYPDIVYGECVCSPECREKTTIPKQTDRRQLWFSGEPVRYVRGHSAQQRFKYKGVPRYLIDPSTGCWIWQRGSHHGYGTTSERGRSEYAYVVEYEKRYGSVPKGFELHHRCVEQGYGSTMCCNYRHLEVVTHAVNIQRSRRAKLTAEDVRLLRRLHSEGGWSYVALANRFGIARNTISSIIRRKRWPNV